MITREQKQDAKNRAVIVWEYVSNHPEVQFKHELPYELFKLVRYDLCHCPLCTLFLSETGWDCPDCPLDANKSGCRRNKRTNDYLIWSNNEGGRTTYDAIERQEAAKRILNKIENWNIDDEI